MINESSPRSSRHDTLSTQHKQGCGLQSPRPVTATRLCPGKYVVQCLWGHLGRFRDQLLFPVIPKLIFHAPGVTCRPCTCQSGVITENRYPKIFSKNLSTKRKKGLTYPVARYKALIKTNALLEKRRPTAEAGTRPRRDPAKQLQDRPWVRSLPGYNNKEDDPFNKYENPCASGGSTHLLKTTTGGTYG